MKRVRLSDYVPPPKLRPFLTMRRQAIKILDVGCGNRSPSITKRWLPDSEYYGLDREQYNNSPADYACMSGFYEVDLTKSDLSMIPMGMFDLIIVAHVIEHLQFGEELITRLAQKLRPNGKIYLEFPSQRSTRLPSGVHSLNFHDDPSHVRVYTIPQVVTACYASGLTVIESGARRDPKWIAIDLLFLPFQLLSVLWYRKLYGPLLWDLLGFADFVIAAKSDKLN